ncbi:hypothetical protein HMPREF0201_04034 [Cedecea davisae DSM 4568]|uniref:Uncharacterized protein n=1 Tax=Cedecea davisae DSM 4568 TaxID=566551 RepID=S3IMW8_9ENTR|nr:hypothetical protein HMPREF0201_04034 [Cedecea davisae DSM 4568]
MKRLFIAVKMTLNSKCCWFVLDQKSQNGARGEKLLPGIVIIVTNLFIFNSFDT